MKPDRLFVVVFLLVGVLFFVRSAVHADEPTSIRNPSGGSGDYSEPPIRDFDREHWSFLPIKSRLPNSEQLDISSGQCGSAAWTPIDLFIHSRLRELKLDFAESCRPDQWLRRTAFDLTGLPPSHQALDRFRSRIGEPDAFEREIDRMLASPAHGEHVAQSWLDLARYAETDGFEHDKIRPEAWRFRDWVIEAFNEDMPYDRFMQLQIAGDLLSEPRGHVATYFCLAGPDMPDQNDQVERRHNLLNEMTGTVGAVFLGLQLGCAACHDHKYDAISQADFYRVRGVLGSGVGKLERDKPWTSFKEPSILEIPHYYHRGDHRQPGNQLTFGAPRVVASARYHSMIAQSEHPRLAFAQWLCSDENPLPARTMANRIWQSHFGRGLAGTPSDLGVVGNAPSHPELLDWLAMELMESGWSVKQLRRKIVLSKTYRQASLPSPTDDFVQRLASDPEGNELSRFPRRRLSGEQLRDSMLACTDALNRKASGPSVMPPLPNELMSTLLPGQWRPSPDSTEHHRRSIYLFARRNLRFPIFENFDRPDAGASCPNREQSVTATQSLLLFNSQFSLDIARQLARQADQVARDEQFSYLWKNTLSREPTPVECSWCEEFSRQFQDQKHTLVAMALALLNCNEFLYLD